ncbi:MAG: DUF2299 family protein [Candidatus Altiarchaeota archaeon]
MDAGDFNLLKQQITDWCDEEGVNHYEKESDRDHFLLFINYPEKSKLKTLVYSPKDKNDVLMVGSSLTLNSDKFMEAYEKLDKKKLEEFKYSFYSIFLLAQPSVYLKFDGEKRPQRFDVIHKIWLDEKPSKKTFMESLETVNRCREAARYYCLKYFHIYSDDVARESMELDRQATQDYIR